MRHGIVMNLFICSLFTTSISLLQAACNIETNFTGYFFLLFTHDFFFFSTHSDLLTSPSFPFPSSSNQVQVQEPMYFLVMLISKPSSFLIDLEPIHFHFPTLYIFPQISPSLRHTKNALFLVYRFKIIIDLFIWVDISFTVKAYSYSVHRSSIRSHRFFITFIAKSATISEKWESSQKVSIDASTGSHRFSLIFLTKVATISDKYCLW